MKTQTKPTQTSCGEAAGKIALVRSLSDSVKNDLICELNNECLINPDSVHESDNTILDGGKAAVEPYIVLFALYPNDLDPSGHFLPWQAGEARLWEEEVMTNPALYPDAYDPDYGVIHEPAHLAIAIDATTPSHFRINLYLENGSNIITYVMSYEIAMQVAATPYSFFAFVQGQVRARRDGKLPAGTGVEWDYVPKSKTTYCTCTTLGVVTSRHSSLALARNAWRRLGTNSHRVIALQGESASLGKPLMPDCDEATAMKKIYEIALSPLILNGFKA